MKKIFLIFWCVASMLAAQADDLKELLIGQGALLTDNNTLVLQSDIDVSVAKLSLKCPNSSGPLNVPTLTIDLAGHDLCVEAQALDKPTGKYIGGGAAFEQHVTVKNSAGGTAHAYFPYQFATFCWTEQTSPTSWRTYYPAGSLTVCDKVVFGPSFFGADDHGLTSTDKVDNRITFQPGSVYGWENGFDGSRFVNQGLMSSSPVFSFARGSRVSEAIRDYILSDAGAGCISDLDMVSPVPDENGFYEIVATATDVKLIGGDTFTAWPWGKKLYANYRLVGINAESNYHLVLKLVSKGTDYCVGEFTSTASPSWFTEGEHPLTINTGVCGEGCCDTDATLKIDLFEVAGGNDTLVAQDSRSGILIDNRDTYVLQLGETRPVAYSFRGWDSWLTSYFCAITNALNGGTPQLFGSFSSYGGAARGTKDWTPAAAGTYAFTHTCMDLTTGETEVKTATIVVAEHVAEIPVVATDLVFDGTEKIGVPTGTGYTLSDTWKATEKGTYTATATLQPTYVWSDGSTTNKTFTWTIAGQSISGLTATLAIPEGGYTYDGTEKRPTVTIPGLAEGADFTVTYLNNVRNGRATVVIEGIGDYTGKITLTFAIGAKIVHCPPLQSLPYTGAEQIGVPAGEGYVVTGTDRATDAGSYQAQISLLPGYAWAQEDLLNPDDDPELTSFIYTWVITRKSLWDLAEENGWLTALLSERNFVYDGTEKKPTVNLPDLVEGRDYTYTYVGDCTNATQTSEDRPYVSIDGQGNYGGGILAYYVIDKALIYDQDILFDPVILSSYTWDGTPKQSKVAITGKTADVGKTLVEGVDYEVTHGPNVDPGAAWSKVAGLGNYRGSSKWSFQIVAQSIVGKTVTLAEDTFKYDGDPKTPTVTIDGLTEGVDYTVLYKNNVSAGTATVTITGKGGYTGTIEKTFTITPAPITDAVAAEDITIVPDPVTYTGAPVTPDVDVDLPAKFYTVTYADNVNVGTAKAIVTGTGNYTGSIEKEFTIVPASLGDMQTRLSLSPASFVYDGADKIPVVLFDGVASEAFDVVISNNRNAGTATVTITAKPGSNLTGSIDLTFEIAPASLEGKEVSLSPTFEVWDGTAKTPTVTIDGLKQDEDFTVEYRDNVTVGMATAVITGIGNYTGTIQKTFRIAGESIEGKEATLALPPGGYVYDGTAKTPVVTVAGLTEGKDFEVSYAHNVAAGTATVTVTGIGNSAGTIVREFPIAPASISGMSLALSPTTYVYDGTAKTPTATVGDLTAGRDFTVVYANNTDAGTATATVTGVGNYKDSLMGEFTIERASVSGKTIVLTPASCTFDGTAKEPVVSIDGLTAGTDFTVAYANNTAAGVATVTVTGIGNYKDSAGKTFTISAKSMSEVMGQASLAFATTTYTGSPLEPAVTIAGLEEGTDFTVAYANNVNVGTATVTVTGVGNYSGSFALNFTITRKSVTPPTKVDGLVYTGGAQTGVRDSADADWYTLTGETYGTAIGNYTATAALKDTANTQWSDGMIGNKTYNWSIAAASVDESGAYHVDSQTAFDEILPKTVNEGSITVITENDYTPELPAGYVSFEVSPGVLTVAKTALDAAEEPVTFTLDTRLEREIAGSATETFTHSATAWGDVAGDGQAHVTGTRNGESRDYLASDVADGETLAWTPTSDGRYVFTHQPGGVTAVFVVSGLGPEGSGTKSDPYIVHNEEEFAAAMEHGTSPVHIRLEADLTGPLAVDGKKAIIDLNGHTISSGDDGNGNGQHAVVCTNDGSVEFAGTGMVKGGDGEKAGATAVDGSYTKAETVTVIDGLTGSGTEEKPYIVRTADEFAAAVKAGTEPVWVKLGANIPETVTIADSKDVVCDLAGYGIAGADGTAGDADGKVGIDVTGHGDLTLVDSSATPSAVAGGDGANGAPAGNGGAGVKMNGGTLTVGANVSVVGGKGGNATDGDAGNGGEGVIGDVADNDGAILGGNGGVTSDADGDDGQGGKAVTGDVADGEGVEIDGFAGDGTAAHPYVVYSAEELEYLTGKTPAGDDIYLKLGANISPAALPGDVNVHLDLGGHDITAGADADGKGLDALTVADGSGTLALTGTGTVKGGDGIVGGRALAIGDEGRFSKDDTVVLKDGQSGDGSAKHPYVVTTKEQLEDLLAKDTANDPVHFQLADNLAGTVVIDEAKDVVIDLNGHDIVGGNAASGEGTPAIEVTGGKGLTVTDTTGDGQVRGGAGENAEDGGAGVSVAAPGEVTVTGGATVVGGKGGDSADGEGGKGGKGVDGTVAAGEDKVSDGADGASAMGTQARPYEVSTAAELEAAVNGKPGEDVWVKLVGNLAGGAALDGDVNVHLDLNGHDIVGAGGAAGEDGEPALTIGAGAGTVEITGEGTLRGGNGGDDFETYQPGKGAGAIVKTGEPAPAIAASVTLENGADGKSGDGSAEHPYLASSAEEIAELVKNDTENEPVAIKLTNDVEAVVLDAGKDVLIDMNGFDITGGQDADGNGRPGVTVENGGALELVNTSEEPSTVTGGNGPVAGPAVSGVTPTVGDGVTLVDGIPDGGNGTAEHPYLVETAEELEKLLGDDTANDPVYFELTGDLTGPVTIDENKDVVIDLKGHDIVGETDYTGAGEPAIDVTGTGDLLVTDSSDGEKGRVIGGDGENGGDGASAIVIASGTATVDGGVTAQGGNGGDNLYGEAGKGAAGVDGNVETTNGGVIADGVDGVRGDGTAEHPFVAANADELEAIVNGTTPGATVYVELIGEIERGVTLDGDVDAHIDLNGHSIVGRDGATGEDGESAVTLGAGDGSLEIFGTGSVTGGNGGDNFGGEPGKGAKAVPETVTVASNVNVTDGVDGKNGDGSVTYPYLVKTAAELEQVVRDHEGATPVYVKLADEIGSVSLTEDKDVTIDLNGHDIVGGQNGEDGVPGISVFGDISLNLVNSSDETATVYGGDGNIGAEAVSGVTPTVGAKVELQNGRSGDGSAEHPFVVYSAEELAETVGGVGAGEDVYVKLGADIGAAEVKGDVNLHLDLDGKDIVSAADDGAGNGLPGLTVGEGDGTLELTNSNAEDESLVKGADATGKGGAGGPAVVMAGGREPTVGEGVKLENGLTGTGAEDDPFVVNDADEFARALEKGTSPVCIVLNADFDETLTVDVDKDVVLDLNGHSVTGATDDEGNGLPGLDVSGAGDLTLLGPGTVTGGTGDDSADGAAGDGGAGVQMNGGALTVGDDAFVTGGNGGNTETGTVGRGGKGVAPEGTAVDGQLDNVTDGKDGSSFAEYLKDIFGDGVEVETLPDGGHKVTLQGDITGPVRIPDSIGELEIDLNGHGITGPNGGAGEDGQPAVIVTKTGKAETPADISFSGEGDVTGGNGGDSTTGNGGNGGAGIAFEDGANAVVNIGEDVTVKGGNGGAGAYSEEGTAGNGGKGGDSVIGTVGEVDGTRQGGNGGNGGDTGDGKSGSGGLGGDFGLPSEGDSGKTGVTEGGKTALLEYLFGGEENVDVTKDPDGTYRVTLKEDLDGTITIPDSFGDIIVDLNNHTITGPNGENKVPGGPSVDPDGQPAVRIEATGKGEDTTTVQFVDGSVEGGGQLVGGKGSSNPIGAGAPALLVDDGTPIQVDVVEPVTTVDGKDGCATLALDAVSQAYPWTNALKIDYTIDGDATGSRFTVTLTDPATGASYSKTLSGAELFEGSHTVVWPAAEDCGALVAKGATVTVVVAPEGATKKDVTWQEQSATVDVDLRAGTEEDPRVINTIDDLLPITYGAGDTVKEGETVLVNAAAEAGSIDWTPSADGKVRLTKTGPGGTEEAWFQVAEGVSGKPKFTLPVDFKDGKGDQEIVIPRTWLGEKFGDEIGGKTDEQIAKMLEETDPNGLPKWQNKAVGWSGAEPTLNDISISKSTKKMTVVGLGLPEAIDCTLPDVAAKYVLKKLVHVEADGTKTFGTDLENDVWEDVPGKVSDAPKFDIDLTSGDPTGLYRIYLRFESVK